MSETRYCQQCGTIFAPRREHARFCCCPCRIAWNRENAAGRAVQLTALNWSLTAMRAATERLQKVPARNEPDAFALISEAVWSVTIVGSTLVRYQQETCDDALAGQASAGRPSSHRRQLLAMTMRCTCARTLSLMMAAPLAVRTLA